MADFALRRRWMIVTVAVALATVGCRTSRSPTNTPTAVGMKPATLTDATAPPDTSLPLKDLVHHAEQIRVSQKPPSGEMPPKRTILALSGGGAYGSFLAGVLVGWTEAGTRPAFDVITGVSTGALVATLAFAGPEYDEQLRYYYTEISSRDIYRRKRPIRVLTSESMADNQPFERLINGIITPEFMARLVMEHSKGRRLYVGTTDLDGRRQVVWDIGAMASRGTPEALYLVRKVMLASASVPGFFPPVSIPVDVDGYRLQERHVDGGVSAAVFVRLPYLSPEDRADSVKRSMYGTDLYVLIAGKLYADPSPVKSRSLDIAGSAVSTLLYAQTRDELAKLYTASVLAGMNYYEGAIPEDFPAPEDAMAFNPTDMKKMFEQGRKQARSDTIWRRTPPGVEAGEAVPARTGNQLTQPPPRWATPENTFLLEPVSPQRPMPPVVK